MNISYQLEFASLCVYKKMSRNNYSFSSFTLIKWNLERMIQNKLFSSRVLEQYNIWNFEIKRKYSYSSNISYR